MTIWKTLAEGVRSSRTLPTEERRALRTLIIGAMVFALCLPLALGGGAAIWLLEARDRLAIDTADHLRALNTLQARHVERTVDGLDKALRTAAARLGQDTELDQPDQAAFYAAVNIAAIGMPAVREIMVLDRAGRKVATTAQEQPNPWQDDLAQRDFFRSLVTGGAGRLAVGSPTLDPADGVWRLTLAHAVLNAQAEFGGAVAAVLDVRTLLPGADVGTRAQPLSHAVFRGDGVLLAAHPEHAGSLGQRPATGSPWATARWQAGRNDVGYRQFSTLLGEDALFHLHRIAEGQIVIRTGVTVDAMLVNWRREAWTIGAAAIVVAFALLGTFLLLAARTAEELRLRARNAAAEAAAMAKSRFFAAASHDLRQPLHALGLFASALERRARDQDIKMLSGHIGAAVRSMNAMFASILDLSRIEAGAVQPQVESFPLAPLLRQLAVEAATEAEAKGLRFRCRTIDVVVRTDRTLLETVLRNLLSNALRYTRSGGVLLAVRRRGAHVAIQVIDTGVGIAAEDRDRIFREFERVGPSRGGDPGLGLGLAIVQRLCRALGLRLGMRSTPGRGTAFTLLAPLAARATRVVAGGAAPGRPLRPCRVLIVDDDQLVAAATARHLTDLGCFTRIANTVAAAEQAAADGVDLVVIDLDLRDRIDGIALAERLGAGLTSPPARLILTGRSEPAVIARLASSGLRWANKPADPALLADLVDSCSSAAEPGVPAFQPR